MMEETTRTTLKAPPPKRAKANDDDDDDDAMSVDEQQQQQPAYTLLPGFGEHKRAVSSVKFAPTRLTKRSALCASSSADGVIKLWDLQDGFQAAPTAARATTMTTTTTEAESTADGSPTKTVTKDEAFMEPKLSCTGHSRGINEICWNPVSPLLASASDDKTVRRATKINAHDSKLPSCFVVVWIISHA